MQGSGSGKAIEAMPAMKKKFDRSGIAHIFNHLIKDVGNPMEFELPYWFNEWKPLPYTNIKRSIHLSRCLEVQFCRLYTIEILFGLCMVCFSIYSISILTFAG